jgi:two-component system response regulator RpaA
MDNWILLVEDELFIRDLYTRILVDAGYKVKSAEDGDIGLTDALLEPKPKLILLDVMLPKKNGLEVLSRLKNAERTKNIPVVLVTNLGQEDVIKQAYSIGAQGYLLKMNLEPEQLVSLVKMFFDNPDYKMDFDTLIFD